MNDRLIRTWRDVQALWKPLVCDSDFQILGGLADVFDEAWLRREADRFQAEGHCHHVYRWLTLPWAGRPWRMLELAETTSVISATIASGRMNELLGRLLRRLASYSPAEYFGFFAYEFEATCIGRLLGRQSSRLVVEDLEAGDPDNPIDVLLRIDGRVVYVDLKTLQRPREELDLSLANEVLLRAISARVQLSRGCEIRLAMIPDAHDCEEIAAALSGLEVASKSASTEIEIAAGHIRYGVSSGGITISYDTSPPKAARRIGEVLRSVAVKAAGIDGPIVLMLKLYHFDRADVQLAKLVDLLSEERYSGLAAVALFPTAPMRVGEAVVEEHMIVLNDRDHPRRLNPEQLRTVLAAGL